MKTSTKAPALAVLLTVLLTFGLAGPTKAVSAVNLGTAANFAVLAGSTVTNTGSSVITGALGLSPGTSVTGFPPGTLNGTLNVADATAGQGQTDLVTAYNSAAGKTGVTTIPTELGGTTRTAGVYDSASGTFGITGTLTLDGQNNADAVFVFKTASTLITAGSSTVSLINGAQACNVFWQVGSSATLGTDSTFKGNILALTSITLTTGANVEGRVLARNGAVTFDSNIVNRATCAAGTTDSTTSTTTTDSTTSTTTTDSTAAGTAAAGTTTTGTTSTSTPGLPNAGLPQKNATIPEAIAVLAGALAVVLVVARKKTT